MKNSAVHEKYVFSAWSNFVCGGDETQIVRPEILNSWKRCRQHGVNYKDMSMHHSLDAALLNRLLARKEELIKVAKPFMANLYEFVKGTGFVVVLTDETGYVMEVFGDEDTLKNPLTSNFFRGASWQEEECGTNAIGTGVKAKQPIQVSGAEHYCSKHHCLTCSAAPIFDNRKQLIGLLNISGASCMSHLHTLGMVVAATEAIMAQLDIRRKNQQLALANNRMTNIFNTMSDGVLMVDSSGLVTESNPAAKDILNGFEQEILGLSIEQLFGNKAILTRKMLKDNEGYEDVEIMVDMKKIKVHCFASGEPICDEQGQVIGGVIVLRPMKQIQNLVNRYSGFHASLQFSDIVGESAEIMEAIRAASLATTTSFNILLQGESGTGKEIFAQAIHNKSEQRNGPFVALNCGVIPRELIGSELFGYAEGAFTGARKGGKPGKFELASGGTLFLDEIGDMPLEQQVALLRVLQEKNVTRIGCDKAISVNVRIICATNKNLQQEVEKRTFRQDLYYRLNVIFITIPPLRDRAGDIPLLFDYFLKKVGRDRGCEFRVEPEVIRCLQQFDWPGNVRELQNIVERMVSLTESEVITLSHLPREIFGMRKEAGYTTQVALCEANASRAQRKNMLGAAERQRIVMLLSKSGGNISIVAREMGISRNTVYRKMQLYHIEN